EVGFPTEIIRLNNIRSFRIVSLDKRQVDCDFTDSDETAKVVKRVDAEEHAKGVIARSLPYAVTGTVRGRRRRSGRTAAFYQYAAAHKGKHGLEGCDNLMLRRRARNNSDVIEPGAF